MRWLLFLILCTSVYGQSITEVLYNPLGNDNNREFVEVLGNNLENYSIEDTASMDFLLPLQMRNSSYSLIVEEGFNYTGLNCSIYSIGSAIGNGLSEGESIHLALNGSIVSSMFLDPVTDGHSITTSGESAHIGGSPCEDEPEISEEDVTTCPEYFSITTDKALYDVGDSVKLYFNHSIDPPYSIEYGINDLSGQAKKRSLVTKNTKPKSWTLREGGTYVFYATLDSTCLSEPVQQLHVFASKEEVLVDSLSLLSTDISHGNVRVEFEVESSKEQALHIRIKKNGRTFRTASLRVHGYMKGTSQLPAPCGGSGRVHISLGDREEVEDIDFLDCEETQKNTLSPSIQSFYTRKKTLEENTTFFSRIETEKPVQGIICKEIHDFSTNTSQTLSLELPVSQGNATLHALLFSQGDILSSRSINTTRSVVIEEKSTSSPTCDSDHTTTQEKNPGGQQGQPLQTQVQKPPVITGHVVHETMLQAHSIWVILAISLLALYFLYTGLTGQTNKVHKDPGQSRSYAQVHLPSSSWHLRERREEYSLSGNTLVDRLLASETSAWNRPKAQKGNGFRNKEK